MADNGVTGNVVSRRDESWEIMWNVMITLGAAQCKFCYIFICFPYGSLCQFILKPLHVVRSSDSCCWAFLRDKCPPFYCAMREKKRE